MGLIKLNQWQKRIEQAFHEISNALSNTELPTFSDISLPSWKTISNKFKELHQKQLRDETRIKALDVCQANVMMADNNFNISYMNDSVTKMLNENEKALRTSLSNFDAKNLINKNIDMFHSNPTHQRRLLEGLNSRYETNIEVAGLTFNLIASPVFVNGKRTGTVVEWQDMTVQLAKEAEEQQLSADTNRIKQALDVCKANVMMADANYDIIYFNDSLKGMLGENERKLQESLSKFDMSTLMGTNIDIFHKNPAHQRGILDNLTSTYETQIVISGLTFSLIATPVFDNGARTGTVVEWQDMTAKLAKEAEDQRLSADTGRIKQALDVCKANVMMADANYDIIYFNESLKGMLGENERKL